MLPLAEADQQQPLRRQRFDPGEQKGFTTLPLELAGTNRPGQRPVQKLIELLEERGRVLPLVDADNEAGGFMAQGCDATDINLHEVKLLGQ